jgi:hypothetical protein
LKSIDVACKVLLKGGFVQGPDLFLVLERIGATHLYHANSVTTSCTYLEQGGLASRGFVEEHSLKQTPQLSDENDKKYGIWKDIFLDHVDIHDRSARKNQYGSVLFIFDLHVLLGLPTGTRIRVTKTNPLYWGDGDSYNDRWFRSTNELAKRISFGDFNKMLVIRTPSEKFDFQNRKARIILDDPKRETSSGENAYSFAKKRLTTAVASGRIETRIRRRNCQSGCACIKEYVDYTTRQIENRFG